MSDIDIAFVLQKLDIKPNTAEYDLAARAAMAGIEWFREWREVVNNPPPIREYVLISVNAPIPSGLLAYLDKDGIWYDGVSSRRIQRQDVIKFWRPL